MTYNINTTPLTQLLKLIHAAELSRENEVRIPIATARLITIALAELFEKLSQDYETVLAALSSPSTEVINLMVDGGTFNATE